MLHVLSYITTGLNLGVAEMPSAHFDRKPETQIFYIFMGMVTMSCAGVILGVLGRHQVPADFMEVLEGSYAVLEAAPPSYQVVKSAATESAMMTKLPHQGFSSCEAPLLEGVAPPASRK